MRTHTTHNRRLALFALPDSHKRRLCGSPVRYLRTLARIDDAIDVNSEFIEAILDDALKGYDFREEESCNEADRKFADDERPSHEQRADPNMLHRQPPRDPSKPPWYDKANEFDFQNVDRTVQQLFREWSRETKAERDVCYKPVIRDLEIEWRSRQDEAMKRFSEGVSEHSQNIICSPDGNYFRPSFPIATIRVLVPGQALGRLSYELAVKSFRLRDPLHRPVAGAASDDSFPDVHPFRVSGYELFYHYAQVFSFIMKTRQTWRLFPFLQHFSNHGSRDDHLHEVQIPDVVPEKEFDAPEKELFGLSSHDRKLFEFQKDIPPNILPFESLY